MSHAEPLPLADVLPLRVLRGGRAHVDLFVGVASGNDPTWVDGDRRARITA